MGDPWHSLLKPGTAATVVTVAAHCGCRCRGNGASRPEPLLDRSCCQLSRCPRWEGGHEGSPGTHRPRKDRPREGVRDITPRGRYGAPSRTGLLTPCLSLGSPLPGMWPFGHASGCRGQCLPLVLQGPPLPRGAEARVTLLSLSAPGPFQACPSLLLPPLLLGLPVNPWSVGAKIDSTQVREGRKRGERCRNGGDIIHGRGSR